MPLRPRPSPRTLQPSLAVGLSRKLPTPLCVMRPLGAAWKIDTFRGAIVSSQTTYGTVTKTLSRAGEGVVYSSGGSLITFDGTNGTPWDRSSWCFAGTFITSSTASIQTLVSINGDLNGLQFRINTSAQLEILLEGAALLDTSTATVSVNTPHTYSVCSSSLLGTTQVWLNGQRVINYAGTIDLKDPATAMRFYLARRVTAADNFLVGSMYSAAFWALGPGQLPTPQHQQAFTSYPGLRAAVYRGRRRIVPFFAAASGKSAPYYHQMIGSHHRA